MRETVQLFLVLSLMATIAGTQSARVGSGQSQAAGDVQLEMSGQNAGSASFRQANIALRNNPTADARGLIEEGWRAVKVAGPRDPGFLDGVSTAARLFHALNLDRRVESLYDEAVLACDNPKLHSQALRLRYLLAQDYIWRREYVKAENTLRAGLAVEERSEATSSLYVALLQNLAFVREQEGELEDAERLFRETLAYGPPDVAGVVGPTLIVYPGTPPLASTGDPVDVLAGFYERHWRLSEAEQLIRDQLARAGGDREKRLAALRRLAGFLAFHGSKLEAIRIQEEIVSLVKSQPSQPSDFRAQVVASEEATLARFEVNAGQGEAANQLLEANLLRAQERSGTESPDYQRALNDYFENRRLAGDYATAETLARQKLRLAQEETPPNSMAVRSALLELAPILRSEEHASEADELEKQASGILQDFVPSRWTEMQAHFSAVEQMIRDGRKADALAKVESIANSYFPFEDAELFYFEQVAQSFLTYQQDHESAVRVANTVLAVLEREGAADPRHIHQWIDWAGFYRGQLQDPVTGAALLERAEAMIRSCCGERSPYMESVLRERAWSSPLDKPGANLAGLTKLREFQISIYGANNRAVEETTLEIARFYAGLGKWTHAVSAYKTAIAIARSRTGGRGPEYAHMLDTIAMELLHHGQPGIALALNKNAMDVITETGLNENSKAAIEMHGQEILNANPAGQNEMRSASVRN